MTDPGLNDRLRQRSRRAGLMVGVSMALAIAICLGVFTAIYAGLTPWLSDVVPIAAPRATQITAADAGQTSARAEVPTVAPVVEVAAAPTATPAPTSPPAEPTPTTAADDFEPTHQINDTGQSINLRPEPSTNNNPIRALSPATPLMFLDEESPSPDGTWLRFRTEEGEEGWVREIDTEPYQP